MMGAELFHAEGRKDGRTDGHEEASNVRLVNVYSVMNTTNYGFIVSKLFY
jgi:hypothetical protein